jgi:hypothetical protein
MTAAQETVAATAAWLDGLASAAAAQSNWLAQVAGGAAQTAAALRAIVWDTPPALPTLTLTGPGDVTPSTTVETDAIATLVLSAPSDQRVDAGWALAGDVAGDFLGDTAGHVRVEPGEPSAPIPLRVAPLTLAADRAPVSLALANITGAAQPFPAPAVIRLRTNSAAGRILDVASDQDFKRAEGKAKPGDTVRMAARAYAENAFGAPGVLFMAGEPGVSVTVPGLVTGARAVVQCVAFPRSLRLAAAGCGARACVINAKEDGTDVALTLDGDGSFAEYVEVTDFAHRGILFSGVGAEARYFHIHGQRKGAKSITDTTAGLMWGGTHPKDARSIKAWARYGLIQDIQLHDYCVVKAHDCGADHLTVIGGDTPGDLYVRHGSRFQAIACWVQDGRLLLGDDDAVAIACVTTGKHGATLGFRKGNGTGPEATAGKATYPLARNCRAVAHRGSVDTAWSNGTGPQWKDLPQGTVLEGIAKAQVSGGGPARFVPLATPLPADPARLLTPAEVGPAAWKPAA